MPFKSCLVVFDTQRERDIKLGIAYKFDPLEEGYCNINNQQQKVLTIEEGDFVYMGFRGGKLLNALILNYNNHLREGEKPVD
mmetsp:Transcript_18728/g.17853  ORF Transcript_18728/g.17853 Transcript_18728/m.17853 type:complete len:82 (+) Transcript_18728:714-959(+)